MRRYGGDAAEMKPEAAAEDGGSAMGIDVDLILQRFAVGIDDGTRRLPLAGRKQKRGDGPGDGGAVRAREEPHGSPQAVPGRNSKGRSRSEEHTSELQSPCN